jgi:hypothetical protein
MTKIFRFLLIAFLAILSQQASAEMSTLASTGDYATDLGALNGAVKTVGYMRDICVEQFPDLQRRTGDAYNAWRERYKPFLQEIALRFDLLIIEAAKETNTSLVETTAFVQGGLAKLKPMIKNMHSKNGPEHFRDWCEKYPSTIGGEMGNLEKRYPEHVETVRKVKSK